MREYVILTDSGADLPKEVAAQYEIGVIDLVLQIGEETKLNGEVEPKEFYALLREKTPITTSAVNMERFKEFFKGYLEAGKDVLYLGFSSGLSATYIAGRNAAEELSEEYPERRILTADTLAASLGQGLLVTLAAKKRNEGESLDEVYAFVMENRLKLCHWFTVDDLFFLKRGGRVSAATAVLGTMLAIKPFMHVDNEGHLINVAKVRGRRASIDAMFDKIAETAIAPEGQLYYICHGDCIEDAEYLSRRIKEKYPQSEVMIGYTGTVIGAHSGPGTLALFFLGTQR
ncbi:MAG: DegV family protein [Ruminococcaceae bacterium]|nr:DegV family protein [Oscillospiraceae bacterium]